MRRRDVACDSHREEGGGVEEMRTRRGASSSSFSLRAGNSNEHVMVCSDGLTPRQAASPASDKSCGDQGQALAIATPKKFPGAGPETVKIPGALSNAILPAIATPGL